MIRLFCFFLLLWGSGIKTCLAWSQAGSVWHERLLPIDLPSLYPNDCPNPDQYVQVFRDEFDQGTLDTWFWKPSLGDFHHSPSASETAEWVSANSLLFQTGSPGIMRMNISNIPITNAGVPFLPPGELFDDDEPNWRTWPYQSGAITSKWRFSQGRYLLKVQIPSGRFMWPAFWLFGHCADEIDVFEFMQTNSDNAHDQKVSLSVHSKLNCAAQDPHHDTETYNLGQDMSATFHTYGVTWDDFEIVFTIDNQVRRRLYHYYKKTSWIGIPTLQYQGVANCASIESGETYYYDPQFANSLMEIIANAAVRKGAPASAFPRAMNIDRFVLLEPIDCQETAYLRSQGDLEGTSFYDHYGDRTVTAGQIVVAPLGSLSVQGPPITQWWDPGDLLILTAANEITIQPGFSVFEGGNLIGQIRPCSSNKQPNEEESLLEEEMPVLDDFGKDVLSPPLIRPFILYPSPAYHYVTIEGVLEGDILIIVDLLGRELDRSVCQEDGSFTIPLNEVPIGAYILRVQRSGSRVASKRFIHLDK